MELAVNTNFHTAERRLLYTTLVRWSQRKAADVETPNRSTATQANTTCSCDAELCIEGLCTCPCTACRGARKSLREILLPVIAQNKLVDVTL